ncbi:nucleoside recognition domain-containing protein [Oscillibacter sp.]|uniref:spore maturation protein n=1 Tax=Oscillibacter sp. TaxID=1945593 RepID=UPI003391A094
MSLSAMVVPGLLAGTAIIALWRRVDVYGALTAGAGEGLTVLLRIAPALVGLMTAVAMFRASGAMEWLSGLCAPLLEKVGIPADLTPLMLIRPISGSGALAVGSELMKTYGPDSYTGRVAAVMLGSTETTFYTIAVYFGAAGITRTRHTIPAALTADLVGFIGSALSVRIFFGR